MRVEGSEFVTRNCVSHALARKDRLSQLRTPHFIATVRDVVEVVAIIAAGIWAFYVFAYENRIKPSLADPDVNVTTSMQRLSDRNGLIAVGLHLQLHNIGTVKAHFLGLAINVYGQRIVAVAPHVPLDREPRDYEFDGFYRPGSRIPVYSFAYVTHLGNPSTGKIPSSTPEAQSRTIERFTCRTVDLIFFS